MKTPLTIEMLCQTAKTFAERESVHDEPLLYGVTDGKAVGTYLEHKFLRALETVFEFDGGNSAKGIDLPSLEVDIKVTSIRQPQSSCPFKSARQKIFGLGYSLLLFVYEKSDDDSNRTAKLNILHAIFIDAGKTADFQMTRGLCHLLENDGNEDDIVAFLHDRLLPVDDIEANKIAQEILRETPAQGYLTISNALQWRLQYKRVIAKAGNIDGIVRIR